MNGYAGNPTHSSLYGVSSAQLLASLHSPTPASTVSCLCKGISWQPCAWHPTVCAKFGVTPTKNSRIALGSTATGDNALETLGLAAISSCVQHLLFPTLPHQKVIQRFLSFELVVPLDPTSFGKQGDVLPSPGVVFWPKELQIRRCFPGLLLANHGAVEDVLWLQYETKWIQLQ